ncbi:hypothetical protein D1871_18920 [Nakamurella silvestris]|nr:hypothetical protein D1871_18920 [Nakamurella silvestris]
MKARTVVVILAAVLVLYFVLIGRQGVLLMQSGTVAGIGLGVGVLLLPIIGAILISFELRFGWQTQELGRELEAEGGLPSNEDLPKLPSGRIDKSAAIGHFDIVKAETEAAPTDWRNWFRLADAYEMAGDRKRARESMRRAIELHRA